MPAVAVRTAGNNKENLRSFWIQVTNAPQDGYRWGENGQQWNAIVANIDPGNYDAVIQVTGLQNINCKIQIPTQDAATVFDNNGNEIIIDVEQNQTTNLVTVNLNVNK